MTIRLQQPAPAFHSLLGPARDVLHLERLNPDEGPRVLTIREPKSTLGNSEQCTLRLRAPQVAPVHALLLRGRQGTFARSWSPHSYLNGQPFQITQLHHGDRLQLGDLEFLVHLEPHEHPPLSDGPPPNERKTGGDRSERQRILQLEGQLQSLVAELQALESDRGPWRSDAKTPHEDLEKHEHAGQQDGRATGGAHVLEEVKRTLAEEWEARLEARINQCHRQLDQTLQQVHADRHQLQQQVATLRDTCSNLQTRIEQTRLQTARFKTSVRARQKSHVEQLQHEIQTLRAQLAAAQQEREAFAARLHQQPSAPDRAGQAHQDSNRPWSEVPPVTGASDDYFEHAPQPLETVALAQRFTETDPQPEGGNTPAQTKMPAGEADPPTAVADDEAPDGSGEDDENAIEAYMNQLMDRWRKQQGYFSSGRLIQTPIKLGKPAKAKGGSAAKEQPRQPAPERLDLSTMRELANLNTRFALSLSARQRGLNGAIRNIGVGAVFLLSSQLVFFFSGGMPTMMLSAAIISMLGLLFLALGIANGMRLRTLPHEDDVNGEEGGHEGPTPSPADRAIAPPLCSMTTPTPNEHDTECEN